MTRTILLGVAIVVIAGCSVDRTPTPRATGLESEPVAQAIPSATAFEVAAIAQKYASYTLERAEREGYRRDAFCLDAASFGQPPERGAMGFHATNESLLRGPIDAQRPQALLFDVYGQVLGVEYEIAADAAGEPPRLFGRTFAKLPAHPGVPHEHYALHLWFVDNPEGRFADFNPRVGCLEGTPGSHPSRPDDALPPNVHEGH